MKVTLGRWVEKRERMTMNWGRICGLVAPGQARGLSARSLGSPQAVGGVKNEGTRPDGQLAQTHRHRVDTEQGENHMRTGPP